MKRKLVILAMLALVVASGVFGGNQNIKTYTLFNGSNVADSSERASIWIPIRGASRVYIRTWSAGAAADTDFCDTVTTWKTLLSDSVLFMASDSLGTIVTARSGTSRSTTTHSEPFPMCADSVVITNNASMDSTKLVTVLFPVQGVGKPVRGTSSASGYYTVIQPAFTPILPATNPSVSGANDVLMPGYLRIRITPRSRLTTAGFSSTAGLTTRGINKLKMIAYVLYPNN